MSRRRRRGALLFVLLGVVVALLVVADLTARRVAERELAQRVSARVPSAAGSSAEIRSFPFLGRLLASGQVAQVDAGVSDVTVRGLRFASIAVDLRGVRLSRRQLVNDRRVVLEAIEHGRVRAEVRQDALTQVLGVPVTLQPGHASVTVAGRQLGADVAVRDGKLIVRAAGFSVPALDVTGPLLPCVANAEVGQGRVLLTCDFTEVPAELRAGAQL